MTSRPLCVLVVDDEAPFRRTLVKRLAHRGVSASGAGSGLEALELLARGGVDVVVLDMKMPGIDGIETLARIKERGLPVEVVLLTCHADIDAARLAMEGGAFDYMLKPIDIDELLWAVEEAGGRVRARCGDVSGSGE